MKPQITQTKDYHESTKEKIYKEAKKNRRIFLPSWSPYSFFRALRVFSCLRGNPYKSVKSVVKIIGKRFIGLLIIFFCVLQCFQWHFSGSYK